MKRLLAYTAASILAFALILLAVRVIGSRNQPATALLESGNCEQPCWHGIRPGETSFQQATTILQADSSYNLSLTAGKSLCWLSLKSTSWYGCTEGHGETVQDVELSLPDGMLRLGDAIALFGMPIAARLCWFDSYSQDYVVARLRFEGSIEIEAFDPENPVEWRFAPEMTIIQVYYLSAESPRLPINGKQHLRWRGFTNTTQRGCGES
jgi:hypothetical protein